MSTAVPAMDPADEAGGEVVYSSEGLEPVQVTKPPPIRQNKKDDDDAELELLEDDAMSPQAAFEVFQGKLYRVQTKAKTTAVASGSGCTGTTETPLEQLARLQQEVTALEEQ